MSNTINMNTIKDFHRNGLVCIPYPKSILGTVKKAQKAWIDFCSLPLEVKQSCTYSNKGAGVGYEYKDGSGIKGDRKENFDISLGGIATIQNQKVVTNKKVKVFLDIAIVLINEIVPEIVSFARKIEKEYKLTGFVKEVEESTDFFFLRFIHYMEGAEVHSEIATAHTDQSGFTFHIFESAPGFEYLTYEGVWKPISFSSEETIVIPAMQMQLRSKGILRALCHRVRALLHTFKYGRYSAVCFIQLANTLVYDKESHGRLQEKTPGFNYKMSLVRFKKMFKKR